MKRIIAYILKFCGFEPCYSTNILGKETSGYGKLNSNGWFEYPLKDK